MRNYAKEWGDAAAWWWLGKRPRLRKTKERPDRSRQCGTCGERSEAYRIYANGDVMCLECVGRAPARLKVN